MKASCFAALLICATAAGAQSQAPGAGAQGQATTAIEQSQSTAKAVAVQSQATTCGITCSVDPTASQAHVSPSPAIPPNLAKLAANKSDLDRVVCEAQDTLGTRLGAKKVCMTVSQWLEFQNDVKDQTRRIEILGKISN